jgi:hypothetical protein
LLTFAQQPPKISEKLLTMDAMAAIATSSDERLRYESIGECRESSDKLIDVQSRDANNVTRKVELAYDVP